tara:strand:+ start:3106 stop:4083 length:978 start_codon:yes stop_codon:yes gene_type:complete
MKFIGNKSRLEHFLKRAFINENIPARSNALDLFSGTGSVSKLLSNIGYNTTSVDALKTSYYLTYTKLFNTPSINPKLLTSFLTNVHEGFITENHSHKNGVNIFTEQAANHIDGCLELLKAYDFKNKKNESHFLMGTLIEEADFRSNIMGSYESFYKAGWRKQALKEWTFNLVDNKTMTDNKVFHSSVEDFFLNNKISYDMVYADPPYNVRQYSSVFHVLETISTFYEGEVKGKVNKPSEQFSSDFSSKRKVFKSFENLFNNVSNITNIFYLSYGNEGIMHEKDIIELGNKYFKKIEKVKLTYRRFNTNQKNNKKKVYEYLFKFKK